MSVFHIMPLYEAYRMIGDVARGGAGDDELEAWSEAQAAIDCALQDIRPDTVADLAAQVLVFTRDGAMGLPPAIVQQLQLIVDRP